VGDSHGYKFFGLGRRGHVTSSLWLSSTVYSGKSDVCFNQAEATLFCGAEVRQERGRDNQNTLGQQNAEIYGMRPMGSSQFRQIGFSTMVYDRV